LQRSRELVVEPSELQRLPVTAMIVSHGAGQERRVLLADANPAIGALPVATLAPLAEPAGEAAAVGQPPVGVGQPSAGEGQPSAAVGPPPAAARPVTESARVPPSNLGPPPRLDWRSGVPRQS
jgi:hypothetical protein